MSAAEREIITWMELGSGLYTAAINAGVSWCRAEDWIKEGQEHPGGAHGEFSRQAKAVEAANHGRFRSTNFETPKTLRHRAKLPAAGNGNGSHSNGAQHLLRWEDL